MKFKMLWSNKQRMYIGGNSMARVLIRADNGKLSKILEFDSGQRVEIPINKDGSIRWVKDKTNKIHSK